MKYLLSLVLVFGFLSVSAQEIISTCGKKPGWVDNFTLDHNESCLLYLGKGKHEFEDTAKVIARYNMLLSLVSDEVEVKKENITNLNINEVNEDGIIKYKEKYTFNGTIQTKWKEIRIGKLQEIEFYCEQHKENGKIISKYWVLYGANKNPDNKEDIEVTHYYNFSDFSYRILIPGLPQFYKKQKVKGGLFLGGFAASVIAFSVSQYNYNYYYNKAEDYRGYDEYYYTFYQSHYQDWDIARKVSLTTATVIYFYSIIDAFASRGLIKLKNSKIMVTPDYSNNTTGLNLVYKF